MNYKYGVYPSEQIKDLKQTMRKRIFFLLLCADKSVEEYENVDIPSAINNLLVEFDGLNELLNYPEELVEVMSMLTAARKEYISESYNYSEYRRLILGAGAKVLKIPED